MNVFQRISNGWRIGLRGLAIIRDHPKLIIYPVLTGLALISLSVLFFFIALFIKDPYVTGWDVHFGGTLDWVALFVYGLASVFISTFIQVALVYNIDRVFDNEEIDIMAGLEHSSQRIGKVFTWAVFAATVGGILRFVEENFGTFGRLVSGIFGLAWGLITYFVIPILTFEDLGPLESARRSADIIKAKWGSTIGAGATFAAFYILGFVGAIISAVILWRIHPAVSLLFSVTAFFLIMSVVSAARTVFLTAAYRHTLGNTPYDFDETMLDSLFRQKGK